MSDTLFFAAGLDNNTNGLLGGFVETGTRKHVDGCETSPVEYSFVAHDL